MGPSQKILHPSWCPKLVTGLVPIRPQKANGSFCNSNNDTSSTRL